MNVKSMLAAAVVAGAMGCGGGAETEPFQRRMAAPAAAAGTARLEDTGGQLRSTLRVTGLTPMTMYASHWHSMGMASTTPCDSDGAVAQAFPPFTTDATGAGTTELVGPGTVNIPPGAYINIHEAANLANVALCADFAD